MLVANIKKLCKLKGITIDTLGEEIGIGKKAIYKWDKSFPKIDTLIKVADYFDVSLDFLTERYIYKKNLKSEPEGEYTVITKKAKEKGISPETLAKLIELWGK